MIAKEIELAERYDQLQKVAELYLKGTTSPATIASNLGMRRADVVVLIQEWQELAKDDIGLRDRGRQAVYEMDKHYAMIVERLWETVEQLDMNGDAKSKTAALKAIADVEAKKVETLQKAGLINDHEIADEVAQTQEKVEAIKTLLRNVAAKYPQARDYIMVELSKIFEEAVPVPTGATIVGDNIGV